MTNSAKAKGDQGERDVQALLREELGMPHIRRALGAGRQDDVGDIDSVPNTAIQVARCKLYRLSTVINQKTVDVERQRKNRRVRYAASFIRWDHGKSWVVVLTPKQWSKLWFDAMSWRRYLKDASTQTKKSTRHAEHGRAGDSIASRSSTHRTLSSHTGKKRL